MQARTTNHSGGKAGEDEAWGGVKDPFSSLFLVMKKRTCLQSGIMKHASNRVVECYLSDPIARRPVRQIRVSEEMKENDVCTKTN